MLTIWDDESDDDVKNISDDCAILFVCVFVLKDNQNALRRDDFLCELMI